MLCCDLPLRCCVVTSLCDVCYGLPIGWWPLYTVVVCPVCGKHTKANLINAHLDRCLSDPFPTLPLLSNPPPLPSTPPPSRVPPQIVCDGGIIYKRGSSLPRLPKIVLSIMKDRELRKKLKEYHLPTHGQRAALIARLEEFTLQYKAQQDSLCPKSGKGLLFGFCLAYNILLILYYYFVIFLLLI